MPVDTGETQTTAHESRCPWTPDPPPPPPPLSSLSIVPGYDKPEADLAIVIVRAFSSTGLAHWKSDPPYRPAVCYFKVHKAVISKASLYLEGLCQTAVSLRLLGQVAAGELPRIILEQEKEIVKTILDVVYDRLPTSPLLRQMPWCQLALLWEAASTFQLSLLEKCAEEMLILTIDKAELSEVVLTLARAGNLKIAAPSLVGSMVWRAAREPASRACWEHLMLLPPEIFLKICEKRDGLLIGRFQSLLDAFQSQGYPGAFEHSDASIEEMAQLLRVDTSKYRYTSGKAKEEGSANKQLEPSLANPSSWISVGRARNKDGWPGDIEYEYDLNGNYNVPFEEQGWV